jgi:hypothetical protein
MTLKKRTYQELEDALQKVGAFDPNAAAINAREKWYISGDKVVFTSQLYGMGHNEGHGPIGPMRKTEYSEEELFE